MSTDQTSLADWLRSERTAAGFSIPQLASAISASPDDLNAWEAGKDVPTVAMIHALREVFKAAAGSVHPTL